MPQIADNATVWYFADHGMGPGGRWLQCLMMRTGPHDDAPEAAVAVYDPPVDFVRAKDSDGFEYEAVRPVLPFPHVLVYRTFGTEGGWPPATVYDTSDGWYLSRLTDDLSDFKREKLTAEEAAWWMRSEDQ